MNAIKIISFYSGFLEIICVSLDNNIGHACSPRRCRWTSNRFFVADRGYCYRIDPILSRFVSFQSMDHFHEQDPLFPSDLFQGDAVVCKKWMLFK